MMISGIMYVLIAKSGAEGFQKVYLDNQLVGESTPFLVTQSLLCQMPS